jgi:hypothetical protein
VGVSRGNSKEFGVFSYAFLEGALEMGAPPQLSKNFSGSIKALFIFLGIFERFFFLSLIAP